MKTTSLSSALERLDLARSQFETLKEWLHRVEDIAVRTGDPAAEQLAADICQSAMMADDTMFGTEFDFVKAVEADREISEEEVLKYLQPDEKTPACGFTARGAKSETRTATVTIAAAALIAFSVLVGGCAGF